jgi:arylsulfatase A-like enzyme
VRSDRYKYVQFAADPDVLPPLLFDLEADPRQLTDVSSAPTSRQLGFEAAQAMLRWRMRNDERTLVNDFLHSRLGHVVTRDTWR